jgi:hypothetical protein
VTSLIVTSSRDFLPSTATVAVGVGNVAGAVAVVSAGVLAWGAGAAQPDAKSAIVRITTPRVALPVDVLRRKIELHEVVKFAPKKIVDPSGPDESYAMAVRRGLFVRLDACGMGEFLDEVADQSMQVLRHSDHPHNHPMW